MVISVFESLGHLFSTEGFVPRRVCGQWPTWLVWEHVVGNALVWLASLAIPLVIWLQGCRRAVLAPFGGLAAAFAGFIFLCGLGNLLDMLAFVRPMYRLSGHVLVALGLASWWTIWSIGQAWPALTAMTNPAQLEAEVVARTEELAAANAALREVEGRLRQMADAMPQIVWTATPDGEVDYYNDRWYEMTGCPRGEWGDPSWERALHPDDLAACKEAWYDSVRAGRPHEIEYRLLDHRLGRHRWHLGRAIPARDEAGRIVRWIGTCTDIDDRKRSEFERDRLLERLEEEQRQLRTVIESSQDSIKELDLDGKILSMNLAGQRLLGIRDPRDVLGMPWSNLWGGPLRQAARAAVAKAAAGGVATFEGARSLAAAGDPKLLEVVITPILGAQGRPHRLLCVSKDVTERRRHAEERERLLADAQAANRAKDHFLAVLSHELRTPLNPILLAASSMLERDTPPEDFRPTMEMIRHNVGLQARLIDDLLDVMRIVQGKMPLHSGVVDCHRVIRDAIQVCQSEIFGKKIALTFGPGAEHHHVYADAARLQQVFWNLIKNAVKFSPEGGTIAIRTRDEAGDPGRLIIEVSDTGIGIEPDVLPTIFDPFQQGEKSITRRFGGLGLGLAISRGVVEAHGGTIAAESEGAGRGTTFRIALRPLPDCSPSGDGRTTDGRPAAGPAPSPAPPLNILVVEDEPTTMRLMARLLRNLGHQVTTAGTIAEATRAAEAGDFGLIISDIGLPDGSGLEVIRRVVARCGPVPAIALTGYGMEEDILRCREAGFAVHMTKPIDFTKLEAVIRQVAPAGGRCCERARGG